MADCPLISVNVRAPVVKEQGGVRMLKSPVFKEQQLERLWKSIDPDYKEKQLRGFESGTPLGDDYGDLDPLPGCTIVGCGYNVLQGYYADVRSCLEGLFDLESSGMSKVPVGGKEFAKPKVVIFRPRYATSSYVETGKTIEEYNSSISSKTQLQGDYSFFSASVEVDIGINQAESRENEFSKVQSDVETFVLQLDAGHEKMLKPQVKKDIDEMEDLDNLYDTYGTHYLRSIVMGGHATYTSSTNKSKFSSEFEVGVVASMSFKALVGSISASEEAKYKSSIQSFNESSDTRIQTSGGDPGLGGPHFAEHVDEWMSSVKEYMTLADFVNGETVPLWRLASTAEREHALQNHYPDYCRRKQTTYTTSGNPPLRFRRVPVTTGYQPWYHVGSPDIGGNWSYFGQTNGYGYTIVVQETEPGSGVLGSIAKWEKVGDVDGSSTVWRGVPANPVDYVVLSDFTHRGSNEPTAEETVGIKAVHRSCVTGYWSASGDMPGDDWIMWGVDPVHNPEVSSLTDLKLYVMVVFSGQATRELYSLLASQLQDDDALLNVQDGAQDGARPNLQDLQDSIISFIPSI